MDHEKTNALLNLIREQDNDELIHKIYLYVSDLNKPKYQLLIKKRQEAGMCLDDPKAFLEYSNTMVDVYNNIKDYNVIRKRIVFDDRIAYIMTNKNIEAIIKELFIRCRILNIPLLFITQSYNFVREEVTLNPGYYLVMKIHNKRELQKIANNHSADIDYKDFIKFTENLQVNHILF